MIIGCTHEANLFLDNDENCYMQTFCSSFESALAEKEEYLKTFEEFSPRVEIVEHR